MFAKTKQTNYSFFTFASGKKYLYFAFALARSYRFHNSQDIDFYIISSSDFKLPKDLKKWVRKKVVVSNQFSNGLEAKLFFNEIAPTHYSIFIDSDSIIYGDISILFKILNNESVNVIGHKITTGEWVDLDIPKALKLHNINYLIRYCGALYFFSNTVKTSLIFNEALKLKNEFNDFQKHTYGINEEPILSIAMSKHNVTPYLDDGNIWGDLFHFELLQQCNVIKGRPLFYNNQNQQRYKWWLPNGKYSPLILHFGGGAYNRSPWIFESLRLYLFYRLKIPANYSDFIVRKIAMNFYLLIKTVRNFL